MICEGGESGRTAIWNHNIDMYYQNALHRIRFYGNVIPELYRYILEIYKLSGIINNYLKGMGIQHLVQSSLNAIWFPLPPIKRTKRNSKQGRKFTRKGNRIRKSNPRPQITV